MEGMCQDTNDDYKLVEGKEIVGMGKPETDSEEGERNEGFGSSKDEIDRNILKKGHISGDKVAMRVKKITTISALETRISKKDTSSDFIIEFILVERENMSKTNAAKNLCGETKEKLVREDNEVGNLIMYDRVRHLVNKVTSSHDGIPLEMFGN